MNNLKRILSLALASVMLVGMMVVGASATEFVDDADITHDAAVETMNALGIIGGYAEDNSFRPNVKVTRAQMAKMIAVALNGGKDPVAGLVTGSPFVDVAPTHWAIDYITYCANLGIISGKDPTHYDPEGMVTATETAVMVMRAMGYRNETFLNDKGVYSPAIVDAMAESLGLYNDTTDLTDTGVALTRQNAAQVIYNAVQLPTPEYTMTYNSQGVMTWTLKLVDGDLTGASMLEKHYKAKIGFAILGKNTYNSKTEVFTYTLKNDPSIEEDNLTNTTTTMTTKLDVSNLFMQKVRVVYSGDKADAKATVIGISAVGNNVLDTGVWATRNPKDATDTKPATISGYEYDAEVNKDKAYTLGSDTVITPAVYDTYTLIDNDGDNKIDAIVVNPVEVGAVLNVGKTQVNFKGGNPAAVKLEGNNVAEDLKQNEWVIVTTDAKGVKTVARMDVVENVTATFMDKSQNYTIGGEKYKLFGTSVNLGETYDISVLNGYVFAAVSADGSSAAAGINELVFVSARAKTVTDPKDQFGNPDPTNPNKTLDVELMYANGTPKAIKTITNVYKNADGETADSTRITAVNDVDLYGLYTYTEAKDGTYSLTELKMDGNLWNGMTKNAVANTIKGGKNGTVRFNGDAVVFAYGTIGGKPAVKVFTGAEINEWDTTVTAGSGALFTTTQNGFPYTVVGAINVGTKDNWPGATASGEKYGYLVATGDRAYVAELEGTYTRLQIWTGTETVTRYISENKATFDANSAANKYAAGTIVKYAEAADNTVELKSVTATATAVTAYADGPDIQFKDLGEYTLTNDTVIIYINDADAEGAEESTIQLAGDHPTLPDEYVRNVYVVGHSVDDKLVVDALFVDVNNEIVDQPEE